MVGVREDGLRTKGFHGLGQDGLDGGLGPDGDERRSLDVSVRSVDDADAAGSAVQFGLDLEVRRAHGCRFSHLAGATFTPGTR